MVDLRIDYIKANGAASPKVFKLKALQLAPGEAAGLQDGDVVVQFDGKKVAGANQLVVAIRAKNVGDTVRLTVRRAGQTVDVTLTLQASN